MKSLFFLTLAGLSTWVAYTLHRQQQVKELPTAEHKRQVQQQWDREEQRRREALSA